ncbi:MAG: hypothetical protein OXB99_16115 [Acidimicrobiaceae bacterium]|nr:hypothetical protein [Acidimicrobiaceae bacterium]
MTDDRKTIEAMAEAIKQIGTADGDYTVTEQWSDHGHTVEITFQSNEKPASGREPLPYLARLSYPMHPAGSDLAPEEGEDTRRWWVAAMEVTVPAAKGVARQDWQFMELWLSDDPLFQSRKATRMAQGHHEVQNLLNRYSLVVVVDDGPVAQLGTGYSVLPAVERGA